MKGSGPARILVIKLSALGNFALALGPFKAIREHHRGAVITLLTTEPYARFARASGYFDEVWVDSRPSLWRPWCWLKLARRLKAGRYDRVYDLQTSDRSNAYFRLFGRRRPEWSGIARGCTHPHRNPARGRMHAVERQAEQLAMAGVRNVPSADLSWVKADTKRFGLKPTFALLVPGGAPHRPAKRWPGERFAALSRWLKGQGLQPVLIGAAAERDVLRGIAEAVPGVLDLCGRTSFEEIIALARDAALAVGNDTGPMHLIAAAGCRSLVLFSADSDPARTAPRGPSVTVLRRPTLAALSAEDVIAALHPRRAFASLDMKTNRTKVRAPR
ncbi:MAG: glycosyltransferase family 9 protein [Alphaproteobacteria bacterium]